MTVQSALNTILVVEDNHDDFFAIQRVFERGQLHNPLHHCESGEDALDYLYRRGAYSFSVTSLPALVLLDINLRGMKGTDVLKVIRNEPAMQSLPVIILTSSTDKRDVLAAFEGRASSYMTKPASFNDFIQALQRVKSHQMEIVLVPRT